MRVWFIVTPEYPPTAGGVSDYTQQLARGLAHAGDEVHVFAPPEADTSADDRAVLVNQLPDRFGPRTWRALGRALDAAGGDVTILLQYVPQGFGMRVMNVPFMLWLASRRERLWIIFHEAVFPFALEQPLKHQLLAVVTRAMLSIAALRADAAFVSTIGWTPILTRWAPGKREPRWLPVPSNLPTEATQTRQAVRERLGLARAQQLLVHFGSYSPVVVAPLRDVVPLLLRENPNRALLLVGRNSERFSAEIALRHPDVSRQLRALGAMDAQAAANALSAADLAIFPFPDGVSGRRGSVMAAIGLAIPVLTTSGTLTEAVWRTERAVELVPAGDASAFALAAERLLARSDAAAELGRRGRRFYSEHCAVERVIAALRGAAAGGW